MRKYGTLLMVVIAGALLIYASNPITFNANKRQVFDHNILNYLKGTTTSKPAAITSITLDSASSDTVWVFGNDANRSQQFNYDGWHSMKAYFDSTGYNSAGKVKFVAYSIDIYGALSANDSTIVQDSLDWTLEGSPGSSGNFYDLTPSGINAKTPGIGWILRNISGDTTVVNLEPYM